MADVFFTDEARRLLENKYIIMLGDSNTRAIYKDLITLLTHNKLILQTALRKKQEKSYCGDKLGNHSELCIGRDYVEERSFTKLNTKVEFYFLNRCYTPRIIDLLENIQLGVDDQEIPDVIYINSTLWDMSRWGPNGPMEFKDNLNKLARLFKSSLPESTMVIWATALPVSQVVKSSILLKQTKGLQNLLRFDVMEANSFARQVMAANGFDVLDLHFHTRMQIHRRIHDGVHYQPEAIRLFTNLFLTHLALSWDFPLPNRVQTILLEKAKSEVSVKVDSPTEKQLKDLQKIAENPTKNEETKKPSKELKESRPNLMGELFRKNKRRQGKKKRGAAAFNRGRDNQFRPKEGLRDHPFRAEGSLRDNPFRVKGSVRDDGFRAKAPWKSGKEQRNEMLPPPNFSQGIDFSDEIWLDNSFLKESHLQDRRIPQFQNSTRDDDGQFQNRRVDDSRFQMDVFEARSHHETFSEPRFREQAMFSNNRYRPEPLENGYPDRQYAMDGHEIGIPPFGRNSLRYGNGFRDNEYEPEPTNQRQLLSSMVRSSRYAPY